MRTIVQIIFLVIISGAISYAGRPVYNDLTTSDLIGRATWVVEVKNLHVNKIKLECGWDSEIYNVEVVTVLKTDEKSKFKSGQKIEFNPHPTATTDCALRAETPSGASFSAERYQSSLDVSQLSSSTKFVAFLTGNIGKLKLVADRAIESTDKVSELFKNKIKIQTLKNAEWNKIKMIDVGLDWQGTIYDFCSKNLKASQPVGGTRCDGVRVGFDKDYGKYFLGPCQDKPDKSRVQWKAIGCR